MEKDHRQVKTTRSSCDSWANFTQNLWWTWDDEAQELFEVIDPEIWQKCDQNPADSV